MPPLYITVMGMYTVLTAFILYLVVDNTVKSKSIWEQLMAIFVVVPFLMRLFFIK